MNDAPSPPSAALALFRGDQRIAAGSAETVLVAALAAQEADPNATLLAFDLSTGRVVDLDYRSRPAPQAPEAVRRGRPRLGVVAREVTLLPRHWDWLGEQPGGASVTLRRLVDQARKAGVGADETRHRRERAYRFMSAMAGDAPGFEEASRALFAGDESRLSALMGTWPGDVVATIRELLEPAGEA